MFQKIIFENRYCLLQDSDFKCKIDSDTYTTFVAVILEYKKRKLPIVRNAVLYYLNFIPDGYNFQDINRWIDVKKIFIERNYPELDYGKKYYPCIKRQITFQEMLNKGKK